MSELKMWSPDLLEVEEFEPENTTSWNYVDKKKKTVNKEKVIVEWSFLQQYYWLIK